MFVLTSFVVINPVPIVAPVNAIIGTVFTIGGFTLAVIVNGVDTANKALLLFTSINRISKI
ncbi:MAG: hypothetical protein LBU14_00050 [Candidatus Peribacteria bacterium]|jgi:hypothetical protein|nr:hypothetical protein [Candidatus Peribacteria bacterium]